MAFWVLLTLISSTAYGLNIDIQCGPNGDLVFQKLDTSTTRSLRTEIDRGLTLITQKSDDNCIRKGDSQSGRALALITESNSRSRLWSTRPANKNTWFDKDRIHQIINFALLNGVDPYLALAISINENPPYLSGTKGKYSIYGGIGGTVSGPAIANAFGCSLIKSPEQLGSASRVTQQEIRQFQSYFKALDEIHFRESRSKPEMEEDSGMTIEQKASKVLSPRLRRALLIMELGDSEKFIQLSCFARPGCQGLLRKGKITTTWDLSQSTTSEKKVVNLCFGNELDNPTTPQISGELPADSSRCCAQVKVDSAMMNPGNSGAIDSALAAQIFGHILRSQIQTGKAPLNLTPNEKIIWLLQSYNGRGPFPAWEKNECLKGIDMSKKPAYGATIADLMTNLVMASPSVAEMIDEERVASSVTPKSLLCYVYGAGHHQIKSQDFSDLERDYLSNDSIAPDRLRRCSKGRPPISFRPWTKSEAEAFFGKSGVFDD